MLQFLPTIRPKAFIALVTLVWSLSATAAQAAVSIAELDRNVRGALSEIEQIRLVLGIQPPPEREFVIRDAEPRQVFYQAQTLFRKCNTLAQELAGISRQAPTPAPAEDIDTDDVQQIVNAAREQLGHVRAALGITEPTTAEAANRRVTAGDVLRDIVQAGYFLNALTTRQADWASIYDRVLQMITYVGGALPAEQRFPPLPAFVCCKMPEDVYQRLLAQMESTRPLAETVDLTFMRIISRKRPPNGAATGTVFDLTTTMVTDLGELTLRLDGEDVAIPEYERPARIFPSHAFQLAGVLEAQLTALRNQ